METLLQTLVDTGSAHAILDITGVPAVDTAVAQHLLKTVVAARLMGAECIISGIRPQIAQTVVALGIEFGDIPTKATLADALQHALRQSGVRDRSPHRRARPMDRDSDPQIGELLLVSIQVDLRDQDALTCKTICPNRIVETGAARRAHRHLGAGARRLASSAGCSSTSPRCRGSSTPGPSWWACVRRWRSPWSSSGCRCQAWKRLWTSSGAWRSSPLTEPGSGLPPRCWCLQHCVR